MDAMTTCFEPGRDWSPQIREHNARLLAQQPTRRRGVCTPECFVAKHFDNSRLVKAPDQARVREMRLFVAAMTVLLSLIMVYGRLLVGTIEGGYLVEREKQLLDQLREENRQLRLSEAQLSQPGRIDRMARVYGLAEPQPGQIILPSARPDASAPAVAQAVPPAPAAR